MANSTKVPPSSNRGHQIKSSQIEATKQIKSSQIEATKQIKSSQIEATKQKSFQWGAPSKGPSNKGHKSTKS